MVAGVISKAFGLTGPFLAINSACASSLQAMLLAARALQLGRIEMAVAGGASDCKSDTLVLFAHAQAMSATGSRPFDTSADGLIVGEGYVALVMKTLQRALADGDPIQAVVRGLGVSSDGKGKSLWAPLKEGQLKAMERAYRGSVELAGLQYVEAHATATQLGDATELNTLTEILSEHLPPGKKVPVTSVKANIGHTLEVAGIAGVIKAVLCMQHGMVAPAINVTERNPKIDWDRAPIYIPTSPTPWPAPSDGSPRRAGVNAFGIGGLNMHVVLDDFNDRTHRLVDAGPQHYASTSRSSADDDAIAVIGMGCVFPGAGSVPAYWDLLVSGRNPKCDAPADRWRSDLAFDPGSRRPFHSGAVRGGFITDFQYDWRQHKVPPKQIAQADPLQFMLLDAADQAMVDAGYDKRPFDRSAVSVLVGTEFGGDFAFQLQMGLRLPPLQRLITELLGRRGLSAERTESIAQQFAETLLSHWPSLIDETGSFSTSSLASRISKTWNLAGGAAAIDCGSASALAAVAVSIDMLLAGDCDMMICAAGQRRLGLPEYEALSMAGLLSSRGSTTLGFRRGLRRISRPARESGSSCSSDWRRHAATGTESARSSEASVPATALRRARHCNWRWTARSSLPHLARGRGRDGVWRRWSVRRQRRTVRSDSRRPRPLVAPGTAGAQLGHGPDRPHRRRFGDGLADQGHPGSRPGRGACDRGIRQARPSAG